MLGREDSGAASGGDSSRPSALARLRHEMGWTVRIGGPLALGELGWMSTYIVDALMIGRLPHSAVSIAASSTGNTIYYAIAFFVIYLMNGLETLVAQAFGRGDRREGVHLLGQSLWIVALGTPLTMGLTWGAVALLPYAGTPVDLVAETKHYVDALVWSTLPLLLYMALRRYLQSVNRVLLVSASLITAGLVNWLGDYAFLFGHFGARAMGVAGSGWSTLIVRTWMLALLLVGTALAFREAGHRLRWSDVRLDWTRMKALLKIGWPSGLEYSAELGTSTYIGILCTRMGSLLTAANQVVLDLNAFVYQVPAGLSYAALIRVGQAAGRDDARQVQRATRACLLIGMGFVLISAGLFVGYAPFWASLYTNDPAVRAAASPIFIICGLLQFADATFVIYASALTGLGDTRTVMIVSLLANWGIGAPMAYFLAFPAGYTLHGLWIGRLTGSLLAAAGLATWWQWKLRHATEPGHKASLSVLAPATAK